MILPVAPFGKDEIRHVHNVPYIRCSRPHSWKIDEKNEKTELKKKKILVNTLARQNAKLHFNDHKTGVLSCE